VARVSAGLLMYRMHGGKLEVLLVHPGGPFFNKKDAGAWTIPKGEVASNEELLACAQREFKEEIGIALVGPFHPLKPVKQKGGKTIHAWAFEGNCDPAAVVSNTFLIEWPPRSGRQVEFPEIDRAEFFDVATARLKINAGQVPLFDELEEIVKGKASRIS
jgi:predicted NUDIX family NTP pyrophosphohydrolase